MVSLRKLARTGHVSTQAIDARQLAGVTEDESSFSLFRSKPSYLTALYSVFYTSILNTTGDNSQEKLSKYHPSRYVSIKEIHMLLFIQIYIGYIFIGVDFMGDQVVM